MLEERIRDMEKLMYVVAPQHYIDDEALQMNAPSRVQYNSGGTGVTEIQYVRTSCLPRSATTSPDDSDQVQNGGWARASERVLGFCRLLSFIGLASMLCFIKLYL